MKKVLYIGNNLKNKFTNVSSIQTLGQLFEKEGIQVKYRSSIDNKILRLLDMIFGVIFNYKKFDYRLSSKT